MKNLVLLILGIILGAIAMYFYCCKDEPVEMLPKPPQGTITPAEARTLDEAYNLRHRLISDSIVTREGGDNRSSWYSLTDIEDFIEIAKDQASDSGYTMNGIRIYLGAYPQSKEGAGYTTMFLIPTGYLNTAEGSMLNFQYSNGDIPGTNGLNHGGDGEPPSANYPQ
ncbi:hypothetical protein [uncultured Psychroserpens sp.]|uniref:hypothetical protein n=1 Tax=uncultured Psychroserpens sp. TaxID=255436 RepID=UPI0026223483|nr:hypothetical protein [uncultured Psychroserpens sp.]